MTRFEEKDYGVLLYNTHDVIGKDSFVLLTPENLEKELDKANKQGYLNNDEEIMKKSFNKPNYIPKSSLCVTKICFSNKDVEEFQKWSNTSMSSLTEKHIISYVFANFITSAIATDLMKLDDVYYVMFFPKELYSNALSLTSSSNTTFPNIVFNNGISELHNVKNFKINFGNITIPVTGILDAKLDPDLIILDNFVFHCNAPSNLDKNGITVSYIGYKKDDIDCENPFTIDMQFAPKDGEWYKDTKSFDKYSSDISNLYNIEKDFKKAKPIDMCLKTVVLDCLDKPQFKTSLFDIIDEFGFKKAHIESTDDEFVSLYNTHLEIVFNTMISYTFGPLLGVETEKE